MKNGRKPELTSLLPCYLATRLPICAAAITANFRPWASRESHGKRCADRSLTRVKWESRGKLPAAGSRSSPGPVGQHGLHEAQELVHAPSFFICIIVIIVIIIIIIFFISSSSSSIIISIIIIIWPQVRMCVYMLMCIIIRSEAAASWTSGHTRRTRACRPIISICIIIIIISSSSILLLVLLWLLVLLLLLCVTHVGHARLPSWRATSAACDATAARRRRATWLEQDVATCQISCVCIIRNYRIKRLCLNS